MGSVTYEPITVTKKFAVSDFDTRFRTLVTAINDNDGRITDLNEKVTALEDSGTGNSSSGSSGTSCDCASKGYITQDIGDERYAASVHSHTNYLTESTGDSRYAKLTSGKISENVIPETIARKSDLPSGSTGGSGGSTTWSQSSKTGSTVSFALEEDTEYTCSDNLTSLTITATDFTGEAIVNFKSESTATTFTCTGAKMIGLNCFGGTFTPTTTMCYTIMFDYDGTNVVGYVGGYTNA